MPLDLSRIKAVADLPTHLKILTYGRSGTGKTTILATAPKPLLLIDVRDKGTVSIKSTPDVFVLEISSWTDFEDAYWYLEGAGKEKFKSVAVDTVTQLQDYAIEEALKDDEGGAMTMKRWGEVSSAMKQWITLYRDLPMNVIFTAQDRVTEREGEFDDGVIEPEVGPYVMPSVAKTLCAAVDVIGNTFIREREVKAPGKDGKETSKLVTEFCMRVGPNARYITKLRRPSNVKPAPKVIVNPTFPALFELAYGS